MENQNMRAHLGRIAVLMGGIGEERNISLQSGESVADALKEAGAEVVCSDIRPTEMGILEDASIDVFFVALHGRFGEDGQLQEIMEDKGLIYTGSGPEASRLAFDKMAGKELFVDAGILTPEVIAVNPKTSAAELEKKLAGFSEKYVVKPTRQGSSVGIKIVDSPRAAAKAAKECIEEFGDCMVERFIAGKELTVGVLCGEALPIIEIRPRSNFYDYYAKYIDNGTEYLFDTISDSRLVAQIQKEALKCFEALGCRDFARVDFILSENGKCYALEVNNIPGFTSHSLLPKAAAKAGTGMSRLCTKIVEAAMARKSDKTVGSRPPAI